MKRELLAVAMLSVFCAVSYAGTEPGSSKEMKESVAAAAPCPEWYGDTEWDVSLWGTYAFTGTDWEQNSFAQLVAEGGREGTFDQYLGDDHAWGGGIDLKYFFFRYFGLGLEGFVVDAKRKGFDIFLSGFNIADIMRTEEHRAVGSALGTLTFRFPLHCSRFAPYIWAGGGAIFGGGERDVFVGNRHTMILTTEHTDAETEAIGQFGGGFEIRFTRHIGWINDFSWNVVEGAHNNFGLVRSGVNFAF